MNTKHYSPFLVATFLLVATITSAQHKFVNTPPEVSPMLMKPEMTEIWEP